MIVVGISGYARTGKDELASVLVEEYGYIRIGFADKLRDMLYALNPIVQAEFGFEFRDNWHGPGFVMLQEIIDTYGWDGYKKSEFKEEIRRLLQRLGTEAGRQTLWDSIWVDAAFAKLPPDAKVVVTDCRFKNEADAIRDRGGILVRIHRPEVGPINDHISEIGLDSYPFDYHIDNDGTLDEYKELIRKSGIV